MTNPLHKVGGAAARVGEAAADRIESAVAKGRDTVERMDDAARAADERNPKSATRHRPPGRIRSYFHAALRDEWDGLDRINRDLRLADFFTVVNALMGLGALLLATQGHVRLAVQLVLVGVIMDGIDGAVARLGKGGGPLGGVLDTLADTVTFVTTSAVITFFSLTQQPRSNLEYALILAPLALYVVCGMLRLARFEALRDDGRKRYYFSGIPSPAAAILLLSMVLVQVRDWIVLLVAVYVAILMVSRIRFPKLRGWGAVASVAILLAILVSFRDPTLQRAITWGMLAFMLLYLVGGPFYVLARYGAPPVPQEPQPIPEL
ncbi:MAG TPA: CDP-alcohol phosphatidyltransferase family protein [Candidatus Thermoplasmatota archaeon]|nr:CDP-alcohol phosphatidyltransferase family protein [Candidatus Thermoplasmatota archaeon]